MVGDDSRLEITVVIGKTDAGYTGKLGDTAGVAPESELKRLPTPSGSVLIKIELVHENEILKGFWTGGGFESGAVELTLKK